MKKNESGVGRGAGAEREREREWSAFVSCYRLSVHYFKRSSEGGGSVNNTSVAVGDMWTHTLWTTTTTTKKGQRLRRAILRAMVRAILFRLPADTERRTGSVCVRRCAQSPVRPVPRRFGSRSATRFQRGLG